MLARSWASGASMPAGSLLRPRSWKNWCERWKNSRTRYGRPDVPRIQKVRRKLIDADPALGRFPDAIYHLEILHKEYQQQALQEKLKYLPNDVDVLNCWGGARSCWGRRAKEEDGAVEDYDRAIELDPERFDIYYDKAMALCYRLSKMAGSREVHGGHDRLLE